MSRNWHCSNCGGPYFAKGLCERDLKRQRLGLPLREQASTTAGPTVHVKEKIQALAKIKGPDGRTAEAIPSAGWFTHSELEREAVRSAEECGADLSRNDTIKIQYADY